MELTFIKFKVGETFWEIFRNSGKRSKISILVGFYELCGNGVSLRSSLWRDHVDIFVCIRSLLKNNSAKD